MQIIRKLEILSANHAITIQSFKSSLPKYFCKSKDHLVMKVDDPLFINIKNFEDWDEPNYSYKIRLNKEADNAIKNIEYAISNARTLTEYGRAICREALHSTRSFLNLFTRYIDITYQKLRRAKYTEKRV